MTQDDIAKAIYDNERNLAIVNGDTVPPVWASATTEQKASAVDGVQFYATTPEGTTSALHASWAAAQAVAGWVYGSVLNDTTKVSPLLVDFTLLSPELQAKAATQRLLARILTYEGL